MDATSSICGWSRRSGERGRGGRGGPRLVAASPAWRPLLPVADVARSAAYYEDVLGFRREYVAGSPPVFAICGRDGLSVMLRRVDAPERIVPCERQGGTWDAFFWTDDARALHAELVASGASIVYGPVVQDAYSMLELAVRDCDGHVLGFGQAL